jgi:catechol 2,3-dioxygenase-like lactoylglutathione lyase family enzyme
MKLASFRLVTDDLAALTAFYETLTSVTPTYPFGDDYAEVRTPGCVLAFVSQSGVDEYNSGAATAAANRSAVLEFEVDDVDAERLRLGTIVTEWVQEPNNQPWGNRSMLFRDPDGNLINLYTPPPAES